MSNPINYYWEIPLVRSLEDIIAYVRKKTYSCVHPVGSLNNLVTGAITADGKENHNRPPNQRTSKHVDALLAAIRNCGVCFSIWEKQNADGKGSGTYECTSLMGSDKKLLLKHLPQMFQADHAVEASIRPTVIRLRSVSLIVNSAINAGVCHYV